MLARRLLFGHVRHCASSYRFQHMCWPVYDAPMVAVMFRTRSTFVDLRSAAHRGRLPWWKSAQVPLFGMLAVAVMCYVCAALIASGSTVVASTLAVFTVSVIAGVGAAAAGFDRNWVKAAAVCAVAAVTLLCVCAVMGIGDGWIRTASVLPTAVDMLPLWVDAGWCAAVFSVAAVCAAMRTRRRDVLVIGQVMATAGVYIVVVPAALLVAYTSWSTTGTNVQMWCACVTAAVPLMLTGGAVGSYDAARYMRMLAVATVPVTAAFMLLPDVNESASAVLVCSLSSLTVWWTLTLTGVFHRQRSQTAATTQLQRSPVQQFRTDQL